jgi:hypothetical protein
MPACGSCTPITTQTVDAFGVRRRRELLRLRVADQLDDEGLTVKCVVNVECEHWLRDRGVLESAGHLRRHFGTSRAYGLPRDSGRRTAIARALAGAVKSRPGLLWITGWGVWPSSENMHLFDGLRASFGESRQVHEANGHLYESGDEEILECLLDCVLYFSWDAWLIDDVARSAVGTSHDEALVFCESVPAGSAAWRSVPAALQLQPITVRPPEWPTRPPAT